MIAARRRGVPVSGPAARVGARAERTVAIGAAPGDQCEMSMSAVIDRPTRNGCSRSCLASSLMRTGRRCTTLIQFPVAFWAGTTAKAAPVPPEKPRSEEHTSELQALMRISYAVYCLEHKTTFKTI